MNGCATHTVETQEQSRHGERALERLIGYNCRRAYLAIVEPSARLMAEQGLRPTSYSVLSLIHHEPGLNSRRISQVLGMRPPNLVAMVASLERRGLIDRRPDPDDRRSLVLHLTAAGRRMMSRLERAVLRAEIDATAMLTDAERETLISLLRRIHRPDA